MSIIRQVHSIQTPNRVTKDRGLTCVLDFLTPALSGSSVSEAPFSRGRLALFIGEGASSLIFCGAEAPEPLGYISQRHVTRRRRFTGSPRFVYLAGLLHGVCLAVCAVRARRAGRGASAGAQVLVCRRGSAIGTGCLLLTTTT